MRRGCVAAAFTLAASAPVVYRAMDPVVVNETVLVGGYFPSPSLAATICDRAGACATPPLLAPSPASVKFVVPLSLAGASTYAVTLRDAGGAAAPVILNAPRVDWWRGDGADAPGVAVVGAPLRIFGRNLAFARGGAACPALTPGAAAVLGDARVTAVRAGAPATSADAVELPVTLASCWRVDVATPAALPVGAAMDIYVSNGLAGPGLVDVGGGRAGARVATLTFAAPAPWPPAVFALGTTPGCTTTVSACVAFAGAAGGGTVLLPAGTTYAQSNDNIVFPANASVALQGAGMDASALVYMQGTGFPANMAAVVTGADATARWALRDLTVSVRGGYHTGAQPPGGMPVVVAQPGSRGVRVERARIVEDLRAEPQMEAGNAVRAFGASFFSVIDSDVQFYGNCGAQWPGNTPLNINNATDTQILRTTFTSACQSWAMSGSRTMIADSHFFSVGDVAGGAQLGTDGGAPYIAQNTYFGNSTDVGNPAALSAWAGGRAGRRAARARASYPPPLPAATLRSALGDADL